MKNKLILIINIILLVLLVVTFLIIQLGASKIIIWGCLIIFYSYFFSSINKPIEIINGIKTYIKIDTFFMMFFYLIYYYPYQLYVLGLKDLNSTQFLNNTYSEFSNMAILASTMGLVSFQIGFNRFRGNNLNTLNLNVTKQYLDVLSRIIFILVVFILFLFLNTGMSELFIGAYIGSNTGNITYDAIYSLVTYFIILGIILGICYYFILKKISLNIFLIIIISIVWSIALLILGDRNTFFIIGIVFIAGFFTYIKSINRLKIILLVIGALFIYQIIEVSRVSEKRDFTALWDAFSMGGDNIDKNYEIGSFDITTVGSRAVYKIIPNEHDFFYGKFKLIGLASIIPYSSRLFLDTKDLYTGSSEVLKDEILGRFASWSVGTNIITDCYMDFGIIGIIVFMYLIGWFGGFVSMNAKYNKNSPKWIFIYLITIGFYSEISRYGFDFPLRSIVWAFVLFYFVDNIFNLKKIKTYNKDGFKKYF